MARTKYSEQFCGYCNKTMRMELGGESWTLLHGHPDDVRELAAVLGVKYKKVGERDVAHRFVAAVSL